MSGQAHSGTIEALVDAYDEQLRVNAELEARIGDLEHRNNHMKARFCLLIVELGIDAQAFFSKLCGREL